MKYNKKAFTMTELAITMVIMMVLAVFAILNIKPGENKAKLFLYVAMDHISRGLSTLYESNSSLEDYVGHEGAGIDAYDKLCASLSDFFSLSTVANCKVNASASDVNFLFDNGIEISGLTSEWQDDVKNGGSGNPYKFREFLIDIDGAAKGMNKVGVDRFPMRIYRGDILEGTIMPVDCSQANAGDYCKNGGTKTNINLAKAQDYISYDIYRSNSENNNGGEEVESEGFAVATFQSYMQRDCGIYGGGGYYTAEECAQAGYFLFPKCITAELCAACSSGGSNVCPVVSGEQMTSSTCASSIETYNPYENGCIPYLHRPSNGAGLIFDTMGEAHAD